MARTVCIILPRYVERVLDGDEEEELGKKARFFKQKQKLNLMSEIANN